MAKRKELKKDLESENGQRHGIIPQNSEDENQLVGLIEETLDRSHIHSRLKSLPTGDGSEICTLVSAVFLKLKKNNWSALRRLKSPDALRAYVQKIAERILQDRFRGSGVTRDLSSVSYNDYFDESKEGSVADTFQKSLSPAEQLEMKEMVSGVFEAIRYIQNPRHRHLLHLVVKGEPVLEAARHSGLSSNAAYSAVSRYRKKLREALRNHVR